MITKGIFATQAAHGGCRRLARFIDRHRDLVVLTGAGLSTGSGIPDYRDEDGKWKTAPPMQYADFRASEQNRRRYWARSFSGWRRMAAARPNAAHRAIAELERLGYLRAVITQNVDGLHRAAGSRNVIDLHGRLDEVRCMDCESTEARSRFQERLHDANPRWNASLAAIAPDGDAEIAGASTDEFDVPACLSCGGVLKPDVVFFGERVPGGRVDAAMQALERAQALLVIGSSLMVYSGYRFARAANDAGLPIAIVNRGRTRADAMATIRLGVDCEELLPQAIARLAA